jgi:hypothetical protein
MNLRCLRLMSDPGFDCIELMGEVRERRFQISQFFRAGISNHTMLPRRGLPRRGSKTRLQDRRASAQAVHATRQNVLAVERPPFGGLRYNQCDVRLDLGEANVALILPSIGQEANAEEAEQHHGPG